MEQYFKASEASKLSNKGKKIRDIQIKQHSDQIITDIFRGISSATKRGDKFAYRAMAPYKLDIPYIIKKLVKFGYTVNHYHDYELRISWGDETSISDFHKSVIQNHALTQRSDNALGLFKPE